MNLVLSRDYSKYLRVPYLDKGRDLRGWDCYGLYRWLLAEYHGISLPSYTEVYDSADSAETCGAALALHRPSHTSPVPFGDEREGDGIVFCIGGVPWHCGYVISPGIMLHARKGCDTAIERYTATQWIRRIEGIYRCK